ncbi:MAG: hypothetical protein IKI63_01580 [Clostridia bacterium]|nr:hypothetical protein [Clostridia bacterium]
MDEKIPQEKTPPRLFPGKRRGAAPGGTDPVYHTPCQKPTVFSAKNPPIFARLRSKQYIMTINIQKVKQNACQNMGAGFGFDESEKAKNGCAAGENMIQ